MTDNKSSIFDCQGSGPDLVFLHGWMQDRHSWDSVVENLKSTFTCWTVDLPGFGQNPKPKGAWTPVDYASWVADFIQENKILSPTIIGHSFGGRVAIVLAAESSSRHPELREGSYEKDSSLARNDNINRLVLYATPGLRPPQTWRSKFTKALSRAIKQSGLPKEKIPFYDSVAKTLRSSDYTSSDQLKDIFLATINFDLVPYMSKIVAPTLLIWGDQDTEVPLSVGQKMQKIIKNSTLKTIPGGSHFAHQENSRLLSGLIWAFVNGQSNS